MNTQHKTINLDPKQYKLLSFDIDDTIAESKQPLPDKMAKLLANLSHKYYLHFVTGGGIDLILKNTIEPLKRHNPTLKNILISSNVGAALVHLNQDGSYKTIYAKKIPKKEFLRIKKLFEKALEKYGHNPEKLYGELIEYRTYSITFSALGQKAPVEIKKQWDPTREKRRAIVKILGSVGDDYFVHIAGTTSIDIGYKGIDKAFALKNLQKYLNLNKEQILFFGDSLEPGGNDYPVKQAGFKTVKVTKWQDTYKILKQIFT